MDSKVDYRNIPPGDYTFRVRARGKSQQWSDEATLHFVVLPPWYQTWWAYTLYVLLVILVGYGYTNWRTQSLLRQKKVLEDTVASRTADLKKQKEENSTEIMLNLIFQFGESFVAEVTRNPSSRYQSPYHLESRGLFRD